MTDEENKIKRVFTTYDPSLHEKVFIVKGEEDYARTTDTVLTEILHESGTGIDPETGRREDWNHWITHLKLEFRVEVKRNVGKGAVILYDNDAPLTDAVAYEDNTEYVEWKYEDSETDNRVRLAYGVEHNITARYMENTECLPSVSKSYRFDEPIPTKFESTLSFVGLSEDYAPSSTISFQVKLESENLTEDKEVSLYVDNELYDDDVLIDGDTGLSETITLSNLDYGLHKVYAIFYGDNEVYACDGEQEFGIGYKFSVIRYNPVVVDNHQLTTQVKISNYHDDPVNGVTVQMMSEDHTKTLSNSVTTNSSGFAYITSYNMDDSDNPPFVFTCGGQDSASCTVRVLNSNAEIRADPVSLINLPRAVINYSIYESGEIVNIANIPITITFLTGSTSTIRTNEDGIATYTNRMAGVGNYTVTASFDGLTDVPMEIHFPYVYLSTIKKTGENSLSYSNGVITNVSNGLKFSQSSGSMDISEVYYPIQSGTNMMMEFDIIQLKQDFPVSSVVTPTLYICGISDFSIDPSEYLQNSPHVKVTYEGNEGGSGKYKFYVNGELTYETEHLSYLNERMSIGVNWGKSIIFDNLIIERWNK